MSDTEISRRETLEAAFEASTEPTEAPTPAPVPAEPAPAPAPTPTETPAEPPKAALARDPKGRFAAKMAEIAAEKAAARAKTPPPADGTAKAPVVPKKVTTAVTTPAEAPKAEGQPPSPKAPQSWKPHAREKWATLPPEVQAEAVRVDREARTALEQASKARAGWDAFTRAVSPYQAMLAADGADPIQAVGSLLQTAAQLRTAPPPQRAQLVADIVRTYGVDISLLDAALAGQPAQNGQAQQQAAYRDPRVDGLLAQLQQAESHRAQSLHQTASTDIETFAGGAEFFDDVRADMADLMEMAAKRGVTMTLEDAYNRAIQVHPEVSKVVTQRREAEAANANQASTQRSRAASVSVRTRPAGPATAQSPSGRRAALEAAFDLHNR